MADSDTSAYVDRRTLSSCVPVHVLEPFYFVADSDTSFYTGVGVLTRVCAYPLCSLLADGLQNVQKRSTRS